MTDPPAAAPDLALPQDLTVAPAVDLSQSIPGLHEDGCGCVVGGRGPRPGAGGLLLVVLGLVALRRCARTVMNEPSDRAIMPSAPPA